MIDPTNPVHAEALRNIARSRNLRAQAARLKAEVLQLLDAGDLEGAQQKLADHNAVTVEMNALLDRSTRMTQGVNSSTGRLQ